MIWKNLTFILASTATIAVASHIIKKTIKYFKKKDPQDITDLNGNYLNTKNREINDVILFSDNLPQTIRVTANKDINSCESREKNCYKLIHYIKAARETVDVCMYLITSEEIADQIIRLGQKHVLIRIIVDSEMAYSAPSQIQKLREFSFIQVQTNTKSILMHHKFCIVDGPKAIKRKNKLKAQAEKLNIYANVTKFNEKNKIRNKQSTIGFVMSGSLNWSTHAMMANHESVIVTSNSSIVTKFEKEFDSLWVENDPVDVMYGCTKPSMVDA